LQNPRQAVATSDRRQGLIVPANDPSADDKSATQGNNAHTLLRTFLATAPAYPADAERIKGAADLFLAEAGKLPVIDAGMDWVPIENVLRDDCVIIALPEKIKNVLAEHPASASDPAAAIIEMLEKPLGIGLGSFKAGSFGKKAPGILGTNTPTCPVIIVDRSAHQAMAGRICEQLADAASGARLLGVDTPANYRDELMPLHSSKERTGFGGAGWPETRAIVSNMLVASGFDADKLDVLYAHALPSENYGFMELVIQRKKRLVTEKLGQGSGKTRFDL
jgi:hypothetical protein